jgi:2-phosphosulfolactate phosphatase
MPDVRIALHPSVLEPAALTGTVAVVIDVLRATTTIVHALAAGATSVVPCSEVDEAFAKREAIGADRSVLGGERHGLLIEGFQLDNSPFSYTPETVGGKTVIFTTTNGTRALAASRSAERVLIGAFVNRNSLVAELKRDGRPVWLVCAGTDGKVTGEDVLFAGAIATDLTGSAPSSLEPLGVPEIERIPRSSLSAIEFAKRMYDSSGRKLTTRVQAMRESQGGLNLLENGFERDIARAAEDSIFDLVPEWHGGRITA